MHNPCVGGGKDRGGGTRGIWRKKLPESLY